MTKKKVVEENQEEVYAGDVFMNDNAEATMVQGEPQAQMEPQSQQDPVIESIAVLVNALEHAYTKSVFTMEEVAFLYHHITNVKQAIGMQ